jgi:hypothetical protein
MPAPTNWRFRTEQTPAEARQTAAALAAERHQFPCARPECAVCDQRIIGIGRSVALRLRLLARMRAEERERAESEAGA